MVGNGGGSVQTLDCGTTGPSTGCNVTLPNGPSSTNEDSYVFAGWADSANATEAQYSAGSSFYIRKDTTLYAVYEVTTLSYQVYGGNTAKSTCRRTVKTGVCQVQLKTYEQMVAEGLPERQGYTFLGWSSTSEATSAQYQPGELYTVAPAASPLYGVWGVKASTFTLNFDANAGSDTVTNMPQTQTYTSSDTTHTFTVPTTRPTRQGYTFLYWLEDLHSTEQINPGAQITVGNSYGTVFTKTLYAVWQKNGTDHEIVDGGDGIKYVISSGEPLVIKAEGDLSKFTELRIDGLVVPADKYTKTSEGSQTVITVSPEYLSTLPAGDHIITLAWTDGEVSTSLKIAEKPDDSDIEVPDTSAGTPNTGASTGDNIGGGIAMMILPVVMAGLTTLAYKRNANKAHRKFD